MKKIIILIPLILLSTGCNKLNINNNITSITYNNYKIDETDYKTIVDSLNEINFYCGKKQNYNNNLLTINTKKEILNFHLSNNYYMEYQKDNKYCYTKNTKFVKNLVTELDSLIIKYTNKNSYNIYYQKDYKGSEDDFNIKLDKDNQFIVITTNQTISNFKINEIEYLNEYDYEEINLIYDYDLIDKNNIVIRKNLINNSNIKISFINQYGYIVNIIPKLNKSNNIIFNISIKSS